MIDFDDVTLVLIGDAADLARARRRRDRKGVARNIDQIRESIDLIADDLERWD